MCLFIYFYTAEKVGWLEEILTSMKVLIYSGNQDVIVNLRGTANMVIT